MPRLLPHLAITRIYTERELFAHGFSPLSAVKDMIGNQTDFNTWPQDLQDAAYCAIAELHCHQPPHTEATPTKDVTTEGWIYVPKECLTSVRQR